MKLHRLRVTNFAAIKDADVEFGPGLNVLYGPNDLGKSTLVEAIRLALLLPHSSSHSDQYIEWTGGQDPMVEITFETEVQRIWRVRKQFGKGGSSFLKESKNGIDFDDVERGRKVDGKLREILSWGIPEPGGAGGGKGLPTSFLSTALLSTQADVAAVLESSLLDDASLSGKDRIAAALQAVAQDPLFVTLLRTVQERKDEAYTDKGAKKTAKGSVFKAAAERVNQTREEKERLQKIVADSEGAEQLLRALTTKQALKHQALAVASETVITLDRLLTQAKDRATAAEEVRVAREHVLRIQKMDKEVEAATQQLEKLVQKKGEAERLLVLAKESYENAGTALRSAEELARTEGSQGDASETTLRHQLEIRRISADQRVKEAQQQNDSAIAVQKLLDAADAAETEYQKQCGKADNARSTWSDATGAESSAADRLNRCDLLERALDVRDTEKQKADAQSAVEKEAALRAELKVGLAQHDTLSKERAEILVPTPSALTPMRKLSAERSAARGSLGVGLMVTLTPHVQLDLQVRKDGTPTDVTSTAQPVEFEANAEVEVTISKIATLHVQGGRREAQERVKALDDRWSSEVAPHLLRAGVTDLDALEARVAKVKELDAAIEAKETGLQSLRKMIASLEDATTTLREASDRVAASRAALGDVSLDTITPDLVALGPDPTVGLRKLRRRLSDDLELARKAANEAAKALALAEERSQNSQATYNATVQARNAFLATFPEGLTVALNEAQAAITNAGIEKQNVAAESASLEDTISTRKKRVDAAIADARENAEKCHTEVQAANSELTAVITDHASQSGRLAELKKQRASEDLPAAETKYREADGRHEALPIPERAVTAVELPKAKTLEAALNSELETIDRDIHRATGALEHVGGAVAREALHDANEAFELAERHEREVEEDYEAWRLLLEQMKLADAAQASNLGQVLAPAIAARFQELTQRRYDTVQLTAQLGTEGVVVSGAIRPAERISVGTREQLSTLYRMSLAEYLQTAIVLDDQLVQSDNTRMDWFRALLSEKARGFQIVVFTCRPIDYLGGDGMVPDGSTAYADGDDGFLRAVDLERAIHRI